MKKRKLTLWFDLDLDEQEVLGVYLKQRDAKAAGVMGDLVKMTGEYTPTYVDPHLACPGWPNCDVQGCGHNW